MHVIYGVGGYATFANVTFLLSGLASDLLLLRFWLVCSYVFLLVSGILNFPPWGEWTQQSPNLLMLGAIIWPACVLLLHLYHFMVLLWDERPICFPNEDEEQLWRMFYRRCGMKRLEMKIALSLGSWKRFKAGDTIFDMFADNDQCLSMHLLVEGVCNAVAYGSRSLDPTKLFDHPMYSGFLFDLKVGNAFGVYLGQEQIRLRKVVANTDCLIYVWDFDAVQRMTGAASPALAAFWRNYILYSLGSAFSDTRSELYSSSGEVEDPSVFQGARTRDMLMPLQDYEKSKFSIIGLVWWFFQMHYPIPPSGQRHNGMPPSGMLARGRMMAQEEEPSIRSLRSARSREEGSAKLGTYLSGPMTKRLIRGDGETESVDDGIQSVV